MAKYAIKVSYFSNLISISLGESLLQKRRFIFILLPNEMALSKKKQKVDTHKKYNYTRIDTEMQYASVFVDDNKKKFSPRFRRQK